MDVPSGWRASRCWARGTWWSPTWACSTRGSTSAPPTSLVPESAGPPRDILWSKVSLFGVFWGVGVIGDVFRWGHVGLRGCGNSRGLGVNIAVFEILKKRFKEQTSSRNRSDHSVSSLEFLGRCYGSWRSGSFKQSLYSHIQVFEILDFWEEPCGLWGSCRSFGVL